jgi:integrase
MLYKRGSTWWVRFSFAGREYARSARTTNRGEAQRFEAAYRKQVWEQHQLGSRPRYTWQQAGERWLKERAHKRSLSKDEQMLATLAPDLADLYLDTLTRDGLTALRDDLAQRFSPATANRYMALVRAVLKQAVEWDWIVKAPKVPQLKVATQEPNWISRKDFERLCALLPEHQAAMARFAVNTGLRQRNVSGLKWEQVDLARKCCWIPGGKAKAGKPIPVPLNAEAIAVLKAQITREGPVFLYDGKPVGQVNTKAWRAAVRKAGLTLRWHDLRHTWASWHIQAGTPAFVLQELGGWSSPEMVKRYAHLSPGHLADYAENIGQTAGQHKRHPARRSKPPY